MYTCTYNVCGVACTCTCTWWVGVVCVLLDGRVNVCTLLWEAIPIQWKLSLDVELILILRTG